VELESTIRSLAAELRRTQRLINAIDTSILPFYRGSVKYIKSVLDDKAREEFVRLKITRRILERRRQSGE
ncbi:V-type ATP synthase subunit D, partial [Acidianus hospitalis]